ncbi:hypothetical protein ADT25_16400 [Xanthomonas oryzae]|uniref:Uncharacterized protein n=1 Tax=Xanthomonas oryzae TaxID=347 RepID=A0AAP0ZJX6_9XANT|nr:hypothetical protein ADT25_16400 [Xanthomonas oryzae]
MLFARWESWIPASGVAIARRPIGAYVALQPAIGLRWLLGLMFFITDVDRIWMQVWFPRMQRPCLQMKPSSTFVILNFAIR